MPHTNCRAITAICVQPTQEYFFLWHFCQFHCDAKSLRNRSGLALVFTLQIRCRRTTRFTLLPCCTFSCHTINTICLVVQSFTFYCVMTCLTLLILYQGTILWWMKQGWQRCLLQMHLAVISPKWPKMYTDFGNSDDSPASSWPNNSIFRTYSDEDHVSERANRITENLLFSGLVWSHIQYSNLMSFMGFNVVSDGNGPVYLLCIWQRYGLVLLCYIFMIEELKEHKAVKREKLPFRITWTSWFNGFKRVPFISTQYKMQDWGSLRLNTDENVLKDSCSSLPWCYAAHWLLFISQEARFR